MGISTLLICCCVSLVGKLIVSKLLPITVYWLWKVFTVYFCDLRNWIRTGWMGVLIAKWEKSSSKRTTICIKWPITVWVSGISVATKSLHYMLLLLKVNNIS